MYSKFENLEEDKRQRILNAAMKEFAAKGYDHASTNRIVENAGIAKGLLFHYFKSKKKLYLYLYRYCVELFAREVFEGVDVAQTDFFCRIRDVQRIKFGLIRRFPDLFEFTQSAYLEQSAEVLAEIRDCGRELLQNSTERIFHNIDYSPFRGDLDRGLIITTVMWVFEGFANDFLNKTKLAGGTVDYDRMLLEAERYMEFLRESFYQ